MNLFDTLFGKYLSTIFCLQVYKVVLEVVFKVAPTILLAGFNLRIMIVYRRSCERRRRMTLSRTISNEEDSRTFAEERRLVLLLSSTSILFLVCVSPMVILNVTLSEGNLSLYPYQVRFAVSKLHIIRSKILLFSAPITFYCNNPVIYTSSTSIKITSKFLSPNSSFTFYLEQ